MPLNPGVLGNRVGTLFLPRGFGTACVGFTRRVCGVQQVFDAARAAKVTSRVILLREGAAEYVPSRWDTGAAPQERIRK